MRRLVWLLPVVGAIIMGSCGESLTDDVEGGDTITRHASLLTMVDHGEFIVADISNPWDSASLMQRLVLVHRDSVMPDSLPAGVVLRYPLSSSVVYSSVHIGVIDELGALQAVTGVAESEYINNARLKTMIANGEVVDVGSAQSPSLEKVMMANPEVILASPFQNQTHGAVEQSGIPIIECADYMESTPLGRAEWIKLFGYLYGRGLEADSIFADVENQYHALAARDYTMRPTVLSEMVTDGVWYVPGGRSYMAHLFRDAGAVYPWADTSSAGSLPLDFAAVYEKAHDADIWLVKTYGHTLTLDELRLIYPLNERFKAFASGCVYACDTKATTLYEDFPFHPERLLCEFIKIFHPAEGDTLIYYKNVR